MKIIFKEDKIIILCNKHKVIFLSFFLFSLVEKKRKTIIKINYFILRIGSNLLVSDIGYYRVIILIHEYNQM